MKILLIMLVVVVGMKVFANDNEKMLKTWVTNTDPIMKGVENRQKQRDYDERISNIEFELKKQLKKQKEKERMENNMPEFMIKPYKIPAY